MEKIKQMITDQIKEHEQVQNRINQFLINAPKGTLKIQTKNNRPYYYWQYQGEDGRMQQQYLPKNQTTITEQLAQKRYYEKIKPMVKENLAALYHFEKYYHFHEITEAFDSLSSARKELVIPFRKTVKELVREWATEEYEPYQAHPESLRFETENGEMVRSKSECIIANLLYKQRENLLYKYERPIDLSIYGKDYTIHPDFTVLNTHTGKITYWEHAGLMDDPKYGSDFVWKYNLYQANNIIPGKDVIFTCESQLNPLDIGLVKKMIERLVGDN